MKDIRIAAVFPRPAGHETPRLLSPSRLFAESRFSRIVASDEPEIRVATELIAGKFDFGLYSLEDSPHCVVTEQVSRLFPGVRILHDGSFSSIELERHRASATADSLKVEIARRFGRHDEILADTFHRQWSSTGLRELGRWEAYSGERDELRIVTTPALKRFYPDAECVPLPVAAPGNSQLDRSVRRGLGVRDDEFLVGMAAEDERRDRAALISDVCAALWRAGARIRLLHLIVSPSGNENGGNQLPFVIRHHVSSNEERDRLIAASDLWIAMCVDEFAGSPVSALLALARGIPTIVSRIAATAHVPDGAAVRIRPGLNEGPLLEEAVRSLLQSPAVRAEIGARGRTFADELHAPASVERTLTSLIDRAAPRLLEAASRKRAFYRAEREKLLRRRCDSARNIALPVAIPGERTVSAAGAQAKDPPPARGTPLTTAGTDGFFRTASDFGW